MQDWGDSGLVALAWLGRIAGIPKSSCTSELIVAFGFRISLASDLINFCFAFDFCGQQALSRRDEFLSRGVPRVVQFHALLQNRGTCKVVLSLKNGSRITYLFMIFTTAPDVTP